MDTYSNKTGDKYMMFNSIIYKSRIWLEENVANTEEIENVYKL